MTIQADFIKVLKAECPKAFTDTMTRDQSPHVVFIDGQVKLMKAESITTWPLFLKTQFYNTIEKAFGMGTDTVVLGFDDYRFVPEAKNMTQLKRSKSVPVMEFDADSTLPYELPENWSSAMRNRHFKVKAIHKILHQVEVWFTELVKTAPHWKQRCLILDFCGKPKVLRHFNSIANKKLAAFAETQDDMFWLGRGECDVKAFTWALPGQKLAIMSTDGDFVPMSLLKLKHTSNIDIVLYRIKIQTGKESEGTEVDTKTKGTKRKLVVTDALANKQADKKESNHVKKREYEFVHIGALYTWLQKNMPSKVGCPVEQFCAMVATCGCDFVMNLPRIGAKTMWKYRYKLQNLPLSIPKYIVFGMSLMYFDMMVAKNVTPVFLQHTSQSLPSIDVDTCCRSYTHTIERIKQNTKISDCLKSAVWNVDRALAHAKNTAWTLQYWTRLQEYESTHKQDYGYVKDKRGRTIFAHTAYI